MSTTDLEAPDDTSPTAAAAANPLAQFVQGPRGAALDAYWKHGLRVPLVSPSVVTEDASVASTISGRFGTHRSNRFVQHIARVAQSQRRKLTVFLMARQLRRRLDSLPTGDRAE